MNPKIRVSQKLITVYECSDGGRFYDMDDECLEPAQERAERYQTKLDTIVDKRVNHGLQVGDTVYYWSDGGVGLFKVVKVETYKDEDNWQDCEYDWQIELLDRVVLDDLTKESETLLYITGKSVLNIKKSLEELIRPSCRQ